MTLAHGGSIGRRPKKISNFEKPRKKTTREELKFLRKNVRYSIDQSKK